MSCLFPYLSFSVKALITSWFASSMFLPMLVHWWLYFLLVPWCVFPYWCNGGSIAYKFPDIFTLFVHWWVHFMLVPLSLSLLVHWRIHCLLDPWCVFLCLCNGGSIACHTFFSVGALMAPMLAISLMFLFLLVPWWLHCLLVTRCFFSYWCIDGSIASLFPYVSFSVSALMAPLLASSLMFLFTVGAVIAPLLVCSLMFLFLLVHWWLYCLLVPWCFFSLLVHWWLYCLLVHLRFCIMLYFIWVFTVCKSTRLGVSRIQRVSCLYPFLHETRFVDQMY